MKIKEWIKYSSKLLKNINNFQLDINIILSTVLKKSKSWIICFPDYILNKNDLIILNKFVKRRFYREPLSYLIKKKEFWSLDFYVSNKTIIPRPDSEVLVNQALKIIKNSCLKILDLGTGCGNIAISIASSKPKCFVTGIDYCNEIIKIAKYNSKNLDIKNINFFVSDWFSLINYNKYNLIVSNPPYINFKEYFNLKNEIFFEPINSLVSKNNGIFDINLIIKYAKKYLYHEGWLLLEHSWNQKKKIHALFKKYNYINITTYKDYNSFDRVTIGQFIKFK
ncbi:peptide chain release factor N(5)-glutamine methyltransferase [Buchnera aphidicola]|uniref:peptide chain release factor N(5)-glutamine methyltransferase n=1 Tax=Buchnera aphidicola TaxID=9 RepID=UPI0031B7FFB0